jgi:hypothetical protein
VIVTQCSQEYLEPVQVTKGRIARGKQEILVQWKGLVAVDATWMTLDDFRKVYPSF